MWHKSCMTQMTNEGRFFRALTKIAAEACAAGVVIEGEDWDISIEKICEHFRTLPSYDNEFWTEEGFNKRYPVRTIGK